MKSANDIIKNGYVLIEDEVIKYVGNELPQDFKDCTIIDAKSGILVPGFVNGHTHVPMTLLRNYADGLSLQTWLYDYIFPIEDKLCSDDIYWGSMLGIMEMIATGTTLFADQYYFEDRVAQTVDETGIKAILCRGILCFDENANLSNDIKIKENIELFKEFNNTANGRLKINLGPHAIYTNTTASLRYISEMAAELSCSLHIHISETMQENIDCQNKHNMSPIKYLDSIDFFTVPTMAAHCVFLDDEDIKICKKRGVTIIHNPTSNLKLGSGVAPVAKFKDAGLNLLLGTDGASSNNNLSMFDEINLTGLIHNGVSNDPTLITAFDALKYATNSTALGFSNTGTIEIGKKADFSIISTDKPHFKPMHNPMSNLVYSANGNDVSHVFVDGKLLYDKGEFTTIDKEKVYYNIDKIYERLF